MPVFALDGIAATIHPNAWIAPGAVLIGAVTLDDAASVWFNCTLRADTNAITIGARSNIQDGTIIHVNEGSRFAARIAADVTVGHAAIIHACTLEDHAFVAMGAIVLDGAIICSGGLLAAHSTLPPGKRIGPNELWMGTPAKLVRIMDAAERAHHAATIPHYVAMAARFRTGLRPIST